MQDKTFQALQRIAAQRADEIVKRMYSEEGNRELQAAKMADIERWVKWQEEND